MVRPAETLCKSWLIKCPPDTGKGRIIRLIIPDIRTKNTAGPKIEKASAPARGEGLESFRGTTLIHPPCGGPHAPFTRADGRSYHRSRVQRLPFSAWDCDAKTRNAGNRKSGLTTAAQRRVHLASSPVCTRHRLSVGEGKGYYSSSLPLLLGHNRKNPRRLSRVFSVIPALFVRQNKVCPKPTRRSTFYVLRSGSVINVERRTLNRF
jgi:hypothetical protein